MTNEKAIQLLHRLQDEQFDGIHGDKRREALEMAVRALSGEGDMISRQAAIDALWQEHEMLDSLMDDFLRKGMPIMRSNTKIERNRVENDIFIINQLPSAQPECKTGRWLFPYSNKRYKKCSECGSEFYSIPATSDFCPNCGCKMEVEHE